MLKITAAVAAAAGIAAAGHHYARPIVQKFKATTSAATQPSAPPGVKPIDSSSVPPTEIGMNVAPLVWYLNDEILTDPSRGHAEVHLGGNGPILTDQVQRDADGWPINVKAGTNITYMISTANPLVRSFACTVSPGWRVEGLSLRPVQSGNRFVADVTGAMKDNTWLSFTATHDGASLKQLDCTVTNPKRSGLYREEFLADMRPFRVIRFMNWMLANNSPAATWASRSTPRTMSFAEKGMPLEHMVELANIQKSDPWFTLPLNADDDYVRNFASYVRDHLAPGLRAYVEVSNEVWNGQFAQSKEATRLGKLRYPKADDTQANDFYYADRVRAEMAIWSDIFKGQEKRIVRILSNQAGWSQRAESALGHNDTWRSVDAVAIAPYFGEIPFDVPGEGKERVDRLIVKQAQYIDQAIGWAKANKAVANKFGLPLYAYEAGPGMSAYAAPMVKDVEATYADPRFTAIYSGFLERWRKEIGGLIVLYNYDEGIWGHIAHTGQPWYETPKMTAAYQAIAALPNQRDRLPADALAKITK